MAYYYPSTRRRSYYGYRRRTYGRLYYGRTRTAKRRANGEARAARQQRDSATVTISRLTTVSVPVPAAASSGTAFIQHWDSLRQSTYFNNYAPMYDQIKIDKIRIKLNGTNAGATTDSISPTVVMAFDRNGLDTSQLGEDGISLTTGATGISTYSSAQTKQWSVGNSFVMYQTIYPSTIMEKGQYIPTSTLTTTSSTSNPCYPVTDPQMPFKPISLVGVSTNGITTLANATYIFSAEIEYTVTFRGMRKPSLSYSTFSLRDPLVVTSLSHDPNNTGVMYEGSDYTDPVESFTIGTTVQIPGMSAIAVSSLVLETDPITGEQHLFFRNVLGINRSLNSTSFSVTQTEVNQVIASFRAFYDYIQDIDADDVAIWANIDDVGIIGTSYETNAASSATSVARTQAWTFFEAARAAYINYLKTHPDVNRSEGEYGDTRVIAPLSQTITENGTYSIPATTDVAGYAPVDITVNVSSGGGSATLPPAQMVILTHMYQNRTDTGTPIPFVGDWAITTGVSRAFTLYAHSILFVDETDKYNSDYHELTVYINNSATDMTYQFAGEYNDSVVAYNFVNYRNSVDSTVWWGTASGPVICNDLSVLGLQNVNILKVATNNFCFYSSE